eukprot:3392163-Amphidinium_carterae.1
MHTRKPSSARLQSAFAAYSLGQHQMDAKNFAKLCSDCNLLEGKAKDAEMIFAKSAGGSGRSLSFEDFEAALALIAKHRGVDIGSVIDAVCVQGRVKRAPPAERPPPQSQERCPKSPQARPS